MVALWENGRHISGEQKEKPEQQGREAQAERTASTEVVQLIPPAPDTFKEQQGAGVAGTEHSGEDRAGTQGQRGKDMGPTAQGLGLHGQECSSF